MRDARVGAGVALGTVGIALTLPFGLPALGAGALGAAAGVAVGTTDTRIGWSVAAGSGGFLVGTGIAGAMQGTAVALGVGAVTGATLGVVAWKFPRGGVPLGTTGVGAMFAGVLPAVAASQPPALWNIPAGMSVGIGLGTFIGLIVQPWAAELGDDVPALFPLFFRRWFDLVPEGGVNDALCPNCGVDVNPTAAYCPDCDASLVGMVGPADDSPTGAVDQSTAKVPADAVAVDVACPQCGERPIEERATGVGLLGMLLAYRWRTESMVGCHKCNRRRLFGMAGKNVVLGWWSVITLFVNPFTITYNVGRGLYNAGPSNKLARALDTSGVDYEWLTDRDAFDPVAHGENELTLRGLLRLGTAVMLADGSLSHAEANTMRDAALQLFPDQSADRIEERIKQYAGEVTNADKVAAGLADMLTAEGRSLALVFAAQVATADGEVTDDERVLLGRIAEGLELDSEAVEGALSTDEDTAEVPTAA
ncbi:TerB family tellurite resistance protein [Haloarchaeobius sp. DFWS5]|uniref:TerB family tellurite resistance protein n=1 Tax=Haloarchaeobius sp. DFWS5 TaxID=3446114 RepID=UPI003EBA5F0D